MSKLQTPGLTRWHCGFHFNLQWRATQIQIPQTAVCGCFISTYSGEQHKIRIPQRAVCGNFTPTYSRRKCPDPNATDGVGSLDGVTIRQLPWVGIRKMASGLA
jgi:hypothetical protein